MKRIYLVVGSSGSYDDYVSWSECAYLTKEKAEECAKKLDKKHIYTQVFEDKVWDGVLKAFDDMLEKNEIDGKCYVNSLDYDNPKYEEREKEVNNDLANLYLDILHRQGLVKVTLEDVKKQMDWDENHWCEYHSYRVKEIELYEE